ncbi:MAG: hypothetical protein CMB97_08105 [Flavobacteriaceae bacterium]|nr:hypothetical protein [Flavobacteriaceae bacterium]
MKKEQREWTKSEDVRKAIKLAMNKEGLKWSTIQNESGVNFQLIQRFLNRERMTDVNLDKLITWLESKGYYPG